MIFNHALAQTNIEDDLAQKLSNPVAALISVPIQNNIDYGIGQLKGSRYTLNVQPVIPFSLTSNINLIARVIVPYVDQYNISGVGEHQSGISDIVATAFFTPAKPSNGLVWGVGPAFLIPIGSNPYLTTQKWGVGPSVILLKQQNGWTTGLLANQIWSIAADSSRTNVSQMLVNPFLSYNWKGGATATAQIEWTQNWISGTPVVYFEAMASTISSIGKQKINLALGPKFQLSAPEYAQSKFGLRAVISFLFPK